MSALLKLTCGPEGNEQLETAGVLKVWDVSIAVWTDKAITKIRRIRCTGFLSLLIMEQVDQLSSYATFCYLVQNAPKTPNAGMVPDSFSSPNRSLNGRENGYTAATLAAGGEWR